MTGGYQPFKRQFLTYAGYILGRHCISNRDTTVSGLTIGIDKAIYIQSSDRWFQTRSRSRDVNLINDGDSCVPFETAGLQNSTQDSLRYFFPGNHWSLRKSSITVWPWGHRTRRYHGCPSASLSGSRAHTQSYCPHNDGIISAQDQGSMPAAVP